MWLSLNILSKMVDVRGLSPEEIALRLTMSSAEIEGIEYMNYHLKSVITAKITKKLPHPNADKLTLCDLDAGGETYRVVCGAPNHREGDIVALATVGTKFGDEFVIKKTKIRGEESSGMLCSEKELGLSDDHSGIMILPPSTKTGVPLSELYPDYVDVRFEIDNKSITHRPDLWSHTGFAREIAAIFGREFTSVVNYSLEKEFTNTEPFNVRIDNPKAAPRYCGLAMKNITIAESPAWLKAAVTSIGMRPINNIVDITNYVMSEIGEPMHAFDRRKLRGNEIIVRMASNSESLTTLDGQDHTLIAEDIVIADGGGAIALAGVMGGGNSEIEPDTTDIILEAANFNPVNIRKTSGRYALRTEAAIRFEKALDPGLCKAAIIRCYDLIRQVVPGSEAASVIIDAYPDAFQSKTVATSTSFIRAKLGQQIDDGRIIEILTALDFNVKNDNGALTIGIPDYRATKDVSIPDDIVEEVGRIFGYDNITPQSPFVPCAPPSINAKRQFERLTKDILARNHNYTEVSNYSFVGEALLSKIGLNEGLELKLRNPLSTEQDRLRRSLIPNLIENIELNQRYNESFRIFEMGRVYFKNRQEPAALARETTRVTGVLFRKKTDTPLFYDAKTTVIDLFQQLKIKTMRLTPEQNDLPPYAHPARAMRVYAGKANAGLIFDLHPKIREAFEIKGQAAIFDLDLDILFSAEKEITRFVELQKFPEVPFEISVLADRFTYSSEIRDIITASDKERVRNVDVVSIYEGEPIPKGMKSVSIRIVFCDREKTLAPQDIESLQKKVIGDLSAKGFNLR